MNRRTAGALAFSLVGGAILTFGCQSAAPPATPEETPTENVVILVVTATSQPTLEATQPATEPTITPLPTLTPIGGIGGTVTPSLAAATATKSARATGTNTAAILSAKSPTPTHTPKPVAPTQLPPPTANPVALEYSAPVAVGPSREHNDSYNAGNDIQLIFQSVGPLSANECYAVHADLRDASSDQVLAGDEYFDPNVESHCGDASAQGTNLKFTIFHNGNRPNYSTSLSIAQNAEPSASVFNMTWNVRVVQNNGPSGDGVHYNLAPLSPPSATLEFTFRP